MRYLLDTHTFLWFLEGSGELPKKVKREILNNDNNCFVSIISFWEIAIKLRIRKLNLKFPYEDLVDYLDDNNIELLPLTIEHISKLRNMEIHHKDPFDNILISQGIVEDMTILTKDSNFSLYTAKLLWA